MSKWLVAAALMLSLPVAGRAQFGQSAPQPRTAAGYGVDVPGWWARVDNPHAPLTNLRFAPNGSALHAATGPGAIFWDPKQTASGHYTVTAKFTVNRMPRFEEGYGLFIGGADLDKDTERLTTFLIREDGSYAVRERRGVPVSASQLAWIPDPAIARPAASGTVTNVVAIHVGKTDVIFTANGREVTRRPIGALDTNGIVGLRVADNLDLRIENFSIERFAS